MYSDSHAHLANYPAKELAGLMKLATLAGVKTVLTMGENLETSAKGICIAGEWDGVAAGVGIHPWNAVIPSDDIRKEFEELARRDRVAIIGEIGLDYIRTPETKEAQRELLTFELSLARRLGLPVDVHCRGAHDDMMGLVRPEAEKGLRGIAHGFTGGPSMAQDWLGLGFYLSIGVRGFVTDEMPELMAAIREAPLDRLLTETDIAVVNGVGGPAAVVPVVWKLASVRGISTEEAAKVTVENLKKVLGR